MCVTQPECGSRSDTIWNRDYKYDTARQNELSLIENNNICQDGTNSVRSLFDSCSSCVRKLQWDSGMNNLLQYVLLLFADQNSEAIRMFISSVLLQKVVTITDVKYEINPKLVKMDVVIKQTPEGKTLADLDGYLLEDMNNNIYVSFYCMILAADSESKIIYFPDNKHNWQKSIDRHLSSVTSHQQLEYV